jgi:hypothetical protein
MGGSYQNLQELLKSPTKYSSSSLFIIHTMSVLMYEETGWRGGGVDWIDVAQDRDKWRAVVNAVMKGMILKPIYAHKCMKVYYTHCIPPTCFGHPCGHLQGGASEGGHMSGRNM